MTGIKKNFRRFLQDFYLVIIMIFLYAPIATMVVLSFNQSKSRTVWGGFTLQWYCLLYTSTPSSCPTLRFLLSELIPVRYVPVSYTHLDVYKRQQYLLPAEKNQLP